MPATALSLTDAIARLPEGARVNTFRPIGHQLIGARWSRAQVLGVLDHAERIEETVNEDALALGCGLCLRWGESVLYVETKEGP